MDFFTAKVKRLQEQGEGSSSNEVRKDLKRNCMTTVHECTQNSPVWMLIPCTIVKHFTYSSHNIYLAQLSPFTTCVKTFGRLKVPLQCCITCKQHISASHIIGNLYSWSNIVRRELELSKLQLAARNNSTTDIHFYCQQPIIIT